MCFNEPDYVTVHSVMNIMIANGAKMAQKNHSNGFKVLLSANYWKRVITSTQ